MIRSMTGFGAAEGDVGGVRVSIEIRSVNHRFFNPSIKLPSQFARWEGDVREALRKSIARGHVTVMARVEDRVDEATGGIPIDEAKFAAYVHAIRALARRYDLADTIDAASVLRFPDVISTRDAAEQGSPAELVAVVERAAAALDAMRRSEGERLAAYLEQRLAIVESAVDRIAERAPARLVEQRERLRAAVQELAQSVTVDEQRLALEIAILADRLDVSEEIARFRSHFAGFRGALRSPPADGVGKRLGFLLQELLREANTTGSKANDAPILQDVLLIKEELERIREQVENLE